MWKILEQVPYLIVMAMVVVTIRISTLTPITTKYHYSSKERIATIINIVVADMTPRTTDSFLSTTGLNIAPNPSATDFIKIILRCRTY